MHKTVYTFVINIDMIKNIVYFFLVESFQFDS